MLIAGRARTYILLYTYIALRFFNLIRTRGSLDALLTVRNGSNWACNDLALSQWPPIINQNLLEARHGAPRASVKSGNCDRREIAKVMAASTSTWADKVRGKGEHSSSAQSRSSTDARNGLGRKLSAGKPHPDAHVTRSCTRHTQASLQLSARKEASGVMCIIRRNSSHAQT